VDSIRFSLDDTMGEDNQQDHGISSNERSVEYFMDLALEHAAKAGQKGEVPVGAVIVRDGQVLASDANAPIGDRDPTAHAEIRAIRAACEHVGNYRLNGCTLYVTLEPCAMCAGAMIHARIQRLVFGCPDPKTGAVGTLYNIAQDERLNHQIEVVSGIRGQESAQLLGRFFAERRRGHNSPGSPDFS
jgi:tRNA(adenine34) deaminase